MRRAWGAYEAALAARPLLVKSLSAGALMAASDVAAQAITSSQPPPAPSPYSQVAGEGGAAGADGRGTADALGGGGPSWAEAAGRGYEAWDGRRTATMMGWGLLVAGPGLHYWYRFLDRLWPGATMGACFGKLVLDQSLSAPAFIAAFFTYTGLLEGKSMDEVAHKLSVDYWPTMRMNWTVWPLASFINFRFVPPSQRVLYVSGVSTLWNTYLCWVGHRHAPPPLPAELKRAEADGQ